MIHTRTQLVSGAVFVLGIALGCSSSDSEPEASSGGQAGSNADAAVGGAPGGTGGSGGSSASGGTDSGKPHPIIPVLDCLGETLTLTSSAKAFAYVTATLGEPAAQGSFLLDTATSSSHVDLAALTPTPLGTNCDPTLFGQSCQFASFDFFGPWGGVTFVTADYSNVTGGVKQAGIIGTDFLSVAVFSFDYAHLLVHHSDDPLAFCTQATLDSAGLGPLTSAHFYSNDLSTLHPLSEVIADADPNLTVPNVPTVPIAIGGIGAVVQIDSGYDDSITPFAVNINAAYLAAIQASAPSALVRNDTKDLSLTTCAGVNETIEAYDLSLTTSVDLVLESGQIARSYPNATVFVKQPTTATEICGGIGTWTAPAAQIGASFLLDAGTVVFDPIQSRVWWPKD